MQFFNASGFAPAKTINLELNVDQDLSGLMKIMLSFALFL